MIVKKSGKKENQAKVSLILQEQGEEAKTTKSSEMLVDGIIPQNFSGFSAFTSWLDQNVPDQDSLEEVFINSEDEEQDVGEEFEKIEEEYDETQNGSSSSTSASRATKKKNSRRKSSATAARKKKTSTAQRDLANFVYDPSLKEFGTKGSINFLFLHKISSNSQSKFRFTQRYVSNPKKSANYINS